MTDTAWGYRHFLSEHPSTLTEFLAQLGTYVGGAS